jgi:RNA polymerase sigma-70 factor (ECF subfamily)
MSGSKEELLRAHQAQVHALVSRMLVGHRSAIDDVAQDSLIKVLEALPSFDPKGPAKLSTWILTITARTCIDALRKRRLREAVPGDGEAADERSDPESAAIARETRARVEAAMAKLPDEHRAVLVLRAYHDLDYAEIAAALELEEGTVKSRLARARAALKEVLERGGGR